MTIRYSIIFVSIFTLLLLFANISNVNNLDVFAQNSTNSTAATTTSKTNSGLKITHPEKGSAIPTNSSNSFIVKGTSKYNTTADCKVSIIINNVKPYQPVQALGVNGKEDYSNWQYVLSKNYTNIIQGSNKITAKSSCLNDNPQNTYYSVNVTGMGPEQFKNYNQTNTSTLNNVSSLATIDPQQHPVALEIKHIRDLSPDPSQFAFVADNNNTNQDLNGSSSPTLNNTTSLVSNSTGLNSTAFGLNSYSIVPVVSNSTGLNSTGLNSTAFGLNSYSIVPAVSNNTTFGSNNTTPLVSNSSQLNSAVFGLNSGSIVPAVSSYSIPNSTAFGTSNIIPVSSDSSNHKTDNHKTDNHKTDNHKTDNHKTHHSSPVKHVNNDAKKSKADNHKTHHSSPVKHVNNDAKKSKDKSKTDNRGGSSNDLASKIISKVKRNLSDAGINI